MANPALRVDENVPGDFFVDSTCIDCDQCREIAPASFGDARNTARVYRQPASGDDVHRALMAQLTCPVGAIGSEQKHNTRVAGESLPERIEENVYYCGFASRNSFGAS